MNEQTFLEIISQNEYNATILNRLSRLNLPQSYLTAGCLFQTVWNIVSDRPATENIRDYDVFYYDASDLSYRAEDAVICKAAGLFADLPVKVEVRNQARVHLWFKAKFGQTCPRLNSSEHAIGRFLVLATCVGVSPRQTVYAPHGFDDLVSGRLKPNPANLAPELYSAKVASYQQRWCWLESCEM